jgi:hypothetical protein
VIQAQLQTEDGYFLNHYFTYYIWPLLSNIKWMELIWLFAVSLNFVKIETEGIDSQDAPSGQINIHGVRHICTKFHESITMCSMLTGRSPTRKTAIDDTSVMCVHTPAACEIDLWLPWNTNRNLMLSDQHILLGTRKRKHGHFRATCILNNDQFLVSNVDAFFR